MTWRRLGLVGLGVALLCGAVLLQGGIYTVVPLAPGDSPRAIRLNRWTGAMKFCYEEPLGPGPIPLTCFRVVQTDEPW